MPLDFITRTHYNPTAKLPAVAARASRPWPPDAAKEDRKLAPMAGKRSTPEWSGAADR